ncbi:MAG: LytR C-terminal domain-containing protein [Microbacteriaceae bacterium]|jgi:hypothetical protein|nr:LytR C-terminal domain-containing protein [Microbacteriaceae bacterium]MCI1206697.1 LytR C-terminal domain-containing protein [Microbacteriaceae bacterium]
MAQRYPEDEFDAVERTGRLGAHRSPHRGWRWLKILIAVILIVAIALGVWLLVLRSWKGSIHFDSSTQSPAVTSASPTYDYSATVSVLAGSDPSRTPADVAAKVVEAGWTQTGTASSDTAISVNEVRYSKRSLADSAKRIAKAVGISKVRRVSETLSADVVVRLASTAGASPSASASASASASPSSSTSAKSHEVWVLNGSTRTGVAAAVQTRLKTQGWNVTSAANAPASVRGRQYSYVYYSPTAGRAAAEELAVQLGLSSSQVAAGNLGAPLTVVLGTTYSVN